MRVIVQSKTLPVTSAIRRFAQRQAEKIEKFSGKITSVFVYLEKVKGKDNDPFAASVKYHVHLPGRDVVVRRKATDLYLAMVAAAQRAGRQVRKIKEKRMTTHRDPKYRPAVT